VDPKQELIPYLAVWVLLLTWVARRASGRPETGAGVVLAYVFQMWLLYWIGAAIHALPWSLLPDTEVTLLGFEQATIAMGMFLLGCALSPGGSRKADGWTAGELRAQGGASLPLLYVLAGLVFSAILSRVIGSLPSLNALTAVGQQMIVVGLCLGVWAAWTTGNRRQITKWFALASMLPLTTVVVQGFLGYGVIALSIVMMFASRFIRPRALVLAGLLAASYAGLTFYSAYMRDRTEIRAVVWGGEAASTRIDRLFQTLSSLEPFDPRDPDHLERIDGRLNQNYLVGAAVTHLGNTGDFARGETLWTALQGLIPRVIWPDKPQAGGSGDMVSRFTGLTFAQGTSVGIGPVLEFYANFSTMGVVIGFFCLGMLLGALDRHCASCLELGRWPEFAMWFLIGISCLQVGGSLIEVSSSAIASFVCAKLVNAVTGVRERHRSLAPPRPVPVEVP
jgi:hypothetical protein